MLNYAQNYVGIIFAPLNPTSYHKLQLTCIWPQHLLTCNHIDCFQLNPTITHNDIIVNWSHKCNYCKLPVFYIPTKHRQPTLLSFIGFLSQVSTTLRLPPSRSRHGATTVASWSTAWSHRVVSVASVGQRSITSVTLLHQRSTVPPQVDTSPSSPPPSPFIIVYCTN